MNANQKQRALHEISNWKNACNCRAVQLTGDRMAALLQELIDAPEVLQATNQSQISSSAEPFGWTDCAETDDGAIALYTAPPVSDVEPVAYVTGYNNGYPTIAPINSALCMAIGTALYSAPPAPSVPPVRSTGQWESSRIADYNRGWNACREAMLAATPTPPEPPADVARDIRLQVESEFSALLPGVTYMDEPDGGSPTVQEQVKRMALDAERLGWLEQESKASRTGVSIAYTDQTNDESLLKRGYRLMRYHQIFSAHSTLREAIDAAIERQGGE